MTAFAVVFTAQLAPVAGSAEVGVQGIVARNGESSVVAASVSPAPFSRSVIRSLATA